MRVIAVVLPPIYRRDEKMRSFLLAAVKASCNTVLLQVYRIHLGDCTSECGAFIGITAPEHRSSWFWNEFARRLNDDDDDDAFRNKYLNTILCNSIAHDAELLIRMYKITRCILATSVQIHASFRHIATGLDRNSNSMIITILLFRTSHAFYT